MTDTGGSIKRIESLERKIIAQERRIRSLKVNTAYHMKRLNLEIAQLKRAQPHVTFEEIPNDPPQD